MFSEVFFCDGWFVHLALEGFEEFGDIPVFPEFTLRVEDLFYSVCDGGGDEFLDHALQVFIGVVEDLFAVVVEGFSLPGEHIIVFKGVFPDF